MKTAIHAKDAAGKSQSTPPAARWQSASSAPLAQLTNRLGNRGMQRLRPIQRKCSCGGSCPSCREEEELKLQRKSKGEPPLSHGIALAHQVASTPGEPLQPSVRAQMESRFGFDFAPVRIHRDTAATTASTALGAEAFTTGSHIAFRHFRNDDNDNGLLAHELAHVIQQSRGESPPGGIDSGPSDPLEQAADRASISSTRESVKVGSGAAIQRSPDDGTAEAPAAETEATTAETEPPGAEPEAAGSLDSVEDILAGVSAAGRLFPMLTPLTDAVVLIRGILYAWEHREELKRQLIEAVGGYIETVPALALSKLEEYAQSLGPAAVEALSCVWGQMGAFLSSLADNWLELLGEFFLDMIFPERAIGRAVEAILTNLDGILDDIADLNLIALSHRAVAIMTEVNNVVGIFFLWFALITTAVGTVAGSEVPAAGNAAGGALGASASEIIGIILLTSVLVTEATRILNGISDMTENWDDPRGRQAGCREVAEGVFGIAVTLALFFLGPRIQGFFRSVIARARVIVQDLSLATQRGIAALATPPLEFAGAGGGFEFRGPVPEGPLPEFDLPGARPGTGTRGVPQGYTKVVVEPTVSTAPEFGLAPEPKLEPGLAATAGAQVAEERREKCDEPLPIIWPLALPRPPYEFVMRRGSGEYDGDERGENRNLQRIIRENREDGIPPPCPCYDEDFNENDFYHSHHILPLFLTGRDETFNLCSRQAIEHLAGHADLRYQTDKAGIDPVWIACDQDDPDLARHPRGQWYWIENYDEIPEPVETCDDKDYER